MKTFIDIYSIIGTSVGIIGLIISIVTLFKTSNIEKSIVKHKMAQEFSVSYNSLIMSLTMYSEQLESSDFNPKVFNAILKDIRKIKQYSDTGQWDKDDREIINNCYNIIDSSYKIFILQSDSTNPISSNEFNHAVATLMRELNKVISILEKEGVLYDNGANRKQINENN